MAKPPVSEQVQVNFRMPVDLRDRIKAAAEVDGLSMNHIIVATLEEKYPAPRTAPELDEIYDILQSIKNAASLEDAQRIAAEVNHDMAAQGHSFSVKARPDGDKWSASFDVH